MESFMKSLIVAAAVLAVTMSFAVAQGAGGGPSATPSMTEQPKKGTMREDAMPKKKTKMMKVKKKKMKKAM